MLQFIETLNALQPSWNPSEISRVGPKAGTVTGTQVLGIRKDGVYAAQAVHVHASDPSLNPLMDGRMVMFDVVDFDSDGFASGQSTMDRLIIPVAMGGTYLLIAQVDTDASTNKATQGIVLTLNASIGVGKSEVQQQGTTGSSFNVIGIWRLNDGDYVQLQYQDGAPNANAYLKVIEPGTPSLALLRVGG